MNNFGRIFRVNIFGESHGSSIGVVIDGVPPGIGLKRENFMTDLKRRSPGKTGTTSRIEKDEPEIVSGIFKGKTTGAPISIIFNNENTKSSDYEFIKNFKRPGHADFTAMKKYMTYNDYRGGGHFSGRLTLAIVAAGVIAKKIITPIRITSKILEIGGARDYDKIIKEMLSEKDSIGGIIECEASMVPTGLGEPFFDSVESLISHIVFSIPGIKAIEFGGGFSLSKMRGSSVNDPIVDINGKTKTNFAGGINGGITNGNSIFFKVAVKPTSSIGLKQITYNFKKHKIDELEIRGRHDVCIALRIPPILEAALAIVLADLTLIQKRYL